MISRLRFASVVLLAVCANRLAAQQPGQILAPQWPAAELRPLPPVEWTPPIEPPPAQPAGELTPPDETTAAAPAKPEMDLPPPPSEEAPIFEPEPPPDLWEGSFELGLNGTEGNTRTFNFRFGLDAKRKTARDVFSVDLDYNKKTNGSRETANRAYFDWRYEWLIEDSAWTLFIHGTDDYDEFRPYDVRVTLDAGVGRKFIDNKRTSFLGRFGAGVAREIGGVDDDYVPELNLGLDLSHKISKRQKLTATAEYMPEVADFSDCRVNSKLSWEVLLDEEANLSLKVSIRDRYDSTPGNAEPNDIDYSTVLLWSF